MHSVALMAEHWTRFCTLMRVCANTAEDEERPQFL
jgi:hypothetical protein